MRRFCIASMSLASYVLMRYGCTRRKFKPNWKIELMLERKKGEKLSFAINITHGLFPPYKALETVITEFLGMGFLKNTKS